MKKTKIETYIKWTATAVLIIATAFTSLNIYPLGPILYLLGGILWLIVSIRWKEPALIITNAVLASVNLIGLIYNLLLK
tara:strand:+ start:42 stop:278 length:237 start_codon:yes stop_codon:yes gene_type:complete